MSSNEEVDVYSLTSAELRHLVWEIFELRVAHSVSNEELHELLQYKRSLHSVPDNPVNAMRDELISYIDARRDQLSLPCSGKCYEHTDGVVIWCYHQWQEDTDGDQQEANEEQAEAP